MSEHLDKHDVLVYLDRKIEFYSREDGEHAYKALRELVESGAFDA